MTINVYHKGDVVRVTAEFEDENGAAIDPTTITLKTMDPSGNIATYTYAGGTVTKAAVGSYYKDVDADEEGDWHCWWESTGSGQAAEPTQFVVEPTPF
jgi:hypothetical protein